jgi:hypothetical protein
MPIRFSCPHCRQRLSVSSRKAGMATQCPRCGQSLTIPPPSAEPEPSPDQPPADEAVSIPDASGVDEMDLVYDTAEARPIPPPKAKPDLIALPRYILYAQGALLASVALLAFVLGVLTGSAVRSRPVAPLAAGPCTMSGSVTYASGQRHLPDQGAVIVVLPQTPQRPDERAPVSGLRPGDPPGEAERRGLETLRALGGAHARADANGRFELSVPRAGKYLVVVVSRAKRLKSPDDIPTTDILRIGRFFQNATDLIGDRQYRLTAESIEGDRQFAVLFE